MFNKYKWLEEQKESLKEYIVTEWANDNQPNCEDVYEQLHIDIDRDIIYTNDCWDICKELAPCNEWDKMELGPVTSLQQLAYSALYEFANENLDIEELLNETINENA